MSGKDKKGKTRKIKRTEEISNSTIDNESTLEAINEPEFATAEQVISYLKLIDETNSFFYHVTHYHLPPFVLKVILQFIIVGLNFASMERNKEYKDISLLNFFSMIAVAALLPIAHIHQRSSQKYLNSLPYLQSLDDRKKLEQLHCNLLDKNEIQTIMEQEKKDEWLSIGMRGIVNILTYFNFLCDIGIVTLALSRTPASIVSKLLELSLVPPIHVLHIVFYQMYVFHSHPNQHKKHFEQLKRWSTSDLWKELKPSSTGTYFFDFDLAINDPTVPMDFSFNGQVFKIPGEIIMRELTCTFLKMGLPIVFFSDTRLVLHDWDNSSVKEENFHLLHLQKSLALWCEIYQDKKGKLKQLNYISQQLTRLTPNQEPTSWEEVRYKTDENLPAVYFATNISAMEEKNIQMFLSILEKLYGDLNVKKNDDYLIVDGVMLYKETIELKGNNGPQIPDFEVDTTSGFYSTAQYRDKSDPKEKNENNNNEDSKPVTSVNIAKKVSHIKTCLEEKYSGYLVVPVNAPDKKPGRQFAIMNEEEAQRAMAAYPNYYLHFRKGLKNTSSLKSNNRGNGSSTTGLVKAEEPFKAYDRKWYQSAAKFKWGNARLFFVNGPEETITIDDVPVRLLEAKGFNPTYHS